MEPTTTPDRSIRVGVSSCIVGEEVRFNGGHSRHRYVTDVLADFVDFVRVCPEVEVGMGVPRPTVRLVRAGDEVRLEDPKNGIDWTSAMKEFSRSRSSELADDDLCGFIVKKASPTCGMERVKLHHEGGKGSSGDGQGMFTAELIRRFPFLPVEEDGRLNDPRIRENFVERVFAYRRLKDLFEGNWSIGDVVEFHTREKLLLRAHDEAGYRDLGRLVARASEIPTPAFEHDYVDRFMSVMARQATVKAHTNVLQHMVSFLRWHGDDVGRADMHAAIDDYKAGLVPLVVPVTLMRHLAHKHGEEILLESSYLSPHPKELMLRNHA